MTSKTPQFDKALDAILLELVPHERVCKQCAQRFNIEKEDIGFYRMLRVPPPLLCPRCRVRTRRAFTNYTTFFKKKCNVPGHNEMLISQIPEGGPSPIFDFDYYWSGDWDPMNYGSSFDEKKQFFEQFDNIKKQVPQAANTGDPMSVDSEYAAYGVQLKNCYYVFGGMNAENVQYGNWPMHSRDDVDVLVSWSSDKCFDIVHVRDCYHCFFTYFSKYCLESAFLYDCRNCEYCFGCVNLRNKKYNFFNTQLSEEEYERKMEEINLGNASELERWKDKFLELLRESPKRISLNEQSVRSSGNLLENCKDCYRCFFVVGGENLRYDDFQLAAKDSMDVFLGTKPEKCYFTVSPYDGFEIKFSSMLRGQCHNLEYSMNMRSCDNCFGCVGLVNKKFCILNVQYSEDEYWRKLDEIKTAMLKNGEYGEFFPIKLSPFPYNASLAQLSDPLSEEEAKREGIWYVVGEHSEFSGKIVDSATIGDIEEVSDDILDSALASRGTGRLFRLTKAELAFYKKEHIAIPEFHPEERMKLRFGWLNNLVLEELPCSLCGTPVIGMPPQGMRDHVVCDECHKKVII